MVCLVLFTCSLLCRASEGLLVLAEEHLRPGLSIEEGFERLMRWTKAYAVG